MNGMCKTERELSDPTYRAWENVERRNRGDHLFDASNAEPTDFVLARHDQSGPYSPENCYWRPAKSKRERRTALEDL